MRNTDRSTCSQHRTNRMIEVGGAWYFKTREMGLMGPFRDELEAFTQLEAFLRLAAAGLLPDDGLLPAMSEAAVSVG